MSKSEIEFINKTLNRIEDALSLSIQAKVGCQLTEEECKILYYALKEMRTGLSK